jgi:cyclic pyranopterin phosphate synthase
MSAADGVRDALNRPLRDLRISVTDRCNFRCTYCMPEEVFGPGYKFLGRHELLSFEEITRLARLTMDRGVSRLRITGGEPLVRRELPRLVKMLADLSGLEDLSLTTNGSLLPAHAAPLAAAGLRRVTVSLDSMDAAAFKAMNGVGADVAAVLAGIDAAVAAGLSPVKINAVVRRGMNDHTLVDLARHFRGTGCIVRFIEYMDVGNTNGWQLKEVVPAAEILSRIDAAFPLEAIPPNHPGEVARRWRYRDGAGEIGLITSVSQPFCDGCRRLRLSPGGSLYTCLFAGTGTDVRGLLRSDAGDDALGSVLDRMWKKRDDQYSTVRSAATTPLPRIEMSHIGG